MDYQFETIYIRFETIGCATDYFRLSLNHQRSENVSQIERLTYI